ncbi:MAG: asparagine synthase (glutamine-hydrolyzing) [Candidatus Nanohaloarchaeota archaeon QJJ-7]|nr:asparagine synthase (glutamine-hydrolyzing) [Candidatus Nanohaloarchaeota archaeon QJJ-7]
MCGITGFLGVGDRELVERMTSRLVHRGPDNEGYYIDDNVSLGNRRLSIIGLEAGDQPVHNEDETVWVTYNGEIYNYQELREELRKRGHSFYTDADTEVIVHGYEEWGKDCVERFEGMFAFAVWDSEEEELFLARDRTGKKPLYYFEGDRFYFGSEIKALLEAEEVPRQVDETCLKEYFALGYVTAPNTLFEGVKKLPPGHKMYVRDGEIDIDRYYHFRNQEEFQGSEEKAADILSSKLEDTVEKWSLSDVPVGAFLSGGIDSSAVVSLLQRKSDNPVNTYTIGFGSEKFDEIEPAERTAEELGTDHTSFTMEPGDLELMPGIVYHFDDLLADQAVVPNYLLSRKASEDLKVVVTGSGGDELFAGYEHHTIMRKGDRYLRPFPKKVRRIVPWTLDKVPDEALDRFFPYTSELGPKGKERLRDYLDSVDNPAEAYLQVNGKFKEGELEELIGEGEFDLPQRFQVYFDERDIVQSILELDMETHLVDEILMKTDKTSMAFSLEARTPLLGKEVLDFVSRLPVEYKVRRGKGKRVFRRAVKDVVPDHVMERKKQRFFMPIHDWIGGDMKWFAEEVLNDRSENYLDEKYVQQALAGLDSSPLYYARQIWIMLNFELWHRTFIQGDSFERLESI